jgi:hypothetical protein
VAGYRITVRVGPKVERERYDDLGQAIAAVERRGRDLERNAHNHAIGGKLMRKFEPARQVIGRVELRGPGSPTAGIDVRGDGSAEAFTGRIRREVIDQKRGESAYQALRRTLKP